MLPPRCTIIEMFASSHTGQRTQKQRAAATCSAKDLFLPEELHWCLAKQLLQSTYGEVDHYARLSINKDPKTGAWILYRHDLQAPSFLGHFPSELCPGEAVQIQALTGFVNYQKNARGPPMGSGHFPDNEDPKKSAYFKQVKACDSKGHAWNPITTVMLPLADKPDCYRPSDFLLDFKKGYTFYYGGPSGCVG